MYWLGPNNDTAEQFADEGGFTLVEGLVVLLIMGITVLIAIPNLQRVRIKTETTQAIYRIAGYVDLARSEALKRHSVCCWKKGCKLVGAVHVEHDEFAALVLELFVESVDGRRRVHRSVDPREKGEDRRKVGKAAGSARFFYLALQHLCDFICLLRRIFRERIIFKGVVLRLDGKLLELLKVGQKAQELVRVRNEGEG